MNSSQPDIDVDGNQTPPDQVNITLTTERSQDAKKKDDQDPQDGSNFVDQNAQNMEYQGNPDDNRSSAMGLKISDNQNRIDMQAQSATKLTNNNQFQEDGVLDINEIIMENATAEEDLKRATLRAKQAERLANTATNQEGQYAQEYYALPWFRKPVMIKLCNFWRGIGALMMLFNHIIDALYVMKQEFFDQRFYILILTIMCVRAFTIFVYTICNIKKQVINFNPNLFEEKEAKQMTEEERSIADKLATKHGWMLYSGQGFNMFTGFYRVFDHKDFRGYTAFCLGLDFFCCLLPLFFLQVINNSSFPVEWGLTTLQSACAIMKALCAIEIIIEVLFFAYELLKFRYMKQAGLSQVDDYKTLPEQRKRYKWSKIMIKIALASLAIYILSVGLGSLLLNPRQCDEQQSLVGAVCEECQLENCKSCEDSGPQGCDQCFPGWQYDIRSNTCVDCDGVADSKICLSCTLDDPKQCLECNARYRLKEDNTCEACNDAHCKNCDQNAGVCTECKLGYYKVDGGCAKCSDSIMYCNECSGPDRCEVCDEAVTWLFEENGQCECSVSKNYVRKTDDSPECQCKFGYVLEDNTCARCDQIINDCGTCTNTATYDTAYVYVGTHPWAPEQKPYVTCESCSGNDNKYYDSVDKKCTSCSTHSEGCQKCNEDGTRCTECLAATYLNGAGQCVSCRSYSGACIRCNSQECTRCRDGYFDWFGDCRKNPFS